MKKLLLSFCLALSLCATSYAKSPRVTLANAYSNKAFALFRQSDVNGSKLIGYIDKYNQWDDLYTDTMIEAQRQGRSTANLERSFRDKDMPNAEWFRVINAYRPYVRRFRSMSPVPKSMRRADALWVKFSYQMESALTQLVSWRRGKLGKPIAMNSFRQALMLQNDAAEETSRVLDQSKAKKKYTEG